MLQYTHGMRRVEILNLRKKDINFKEKKIVIVSAKSHKTRIIYIDLKLTSVLFLYCRNLTDNDLLFRIDKNYVSIIFHKTIKKSNLKTITFHDIRHIYASFLLSKLSNKANAILVVQHQLRTFYCCRNIRYLFSRVV